MAFHCAVLLTIRLSGRLIEPQSERGRLNALTAVYPRWPVHPSGLAP